MRAFAALMAAGLLGSVLGVSAAEPPLVLAPGARIGVLNLLTGDVVHYHQGSTLTGSFMRTYTLSGSPMSIVMDPFKERLTQAGFVPVEIGLTETLERGREKLFEPGRGVGSLGRESAAELTRLGAENHLDAMIIVLPAADTAANAQGKRRGELPEYVGGWAFSTHDEGGGISKPFLFNFVQLLLVQFELDGARLRDRDWGGNFSYRWSNFDPGPEPKALSQDEIEKVQPLFVEIISRQLDRLLQRHAPAGAPPKG